VDVVEGRQRGARVTGELERRGDLLLTIDPAAIERI